MIDTTTGNRLIFVEQTSSPIIFNLDIDLEV
jgi:hypothetical protein